jgi:hypothetical protein
MLGFFKKPSKDRPLEGTDNAKALATSGAQFAKEWMDTIDQECRDQLLFVKNFVHEPWEVGEQTGDLHAVITSYCGAVDGTDETARKIFKRFEESAAELKLDILIQYTEIRKLKHLLLLRNFFEYKLKLNLAPAGEEREKIRKMAAQIIDLEFSDQF